MKIKNILVYIFLFLLTALVLDLANPLFDRPSRDGGFFLYAGQQILDGKIPYQDFWDSKGPAIFYINALGLFLWNGSRWGVWILEFIFIFGTFLVLYKILIKNWSINTALFGIGVAGLGLRSVLGYGNYTEEYSLLFNAVGLLLFWSIKDNPQKLWPYFVIGALFGLSFTFRANNIGGLFAILLAVPLFYFLTKNLKEALKTICITLFGFVTPLLLWALYFTLHNTFDEMIYASITFNFSYSAAQERGVIALFNGLIKSGIAWYGRIALLGWFVFTIYLILDFIRQKQASLLNLFLLLWFPIEVLLSNLSGRDFNHYYISWIPSIAFYCTILFSVIVQWASKIFSQQIWLTKLNSYTPVLLVVFLFLISPLTNMRYIETIEQLLKQDDVEYVDQISAYVNKNTQPNDLVLTWYSDTSINFVSDRASPVKYVYYPLFLKDSLTSEIENAYIEDLTTKRPEIILDCSREVDAIPSLYNVTRKEQFATPGLRGGMYIQPGYGEIYDFVKFNYYIETTIDKCIIFRINP